MPGKGNSGGSGVRFMLIFVAAIGQAEPVRAAEPAPSVRLWSGTISSPDAFTEPQYRQLVHCTLKRNGRAIEAWIDTRFELGRGLAAAYRRDTGREANMPEVFAGCYQLRTGSFPFSLDRLARDWADHFGVAKEDPNTLEKALVAQGEIRVTSFQAYVDCIRQKNSPDTIRHYVAMQRDGEKALALLKLARQCSAAPGAELVLDLEAVDRALSASAAN